ncbi:MAG: hypothetical protein AAF519_12665 [Bacteroidota bacterium]
MGINKFKITILYTIGLMSCQNQNELANMQFLTEDVPKDVPLGFKDDVVPNNQLIHRGIFSPDLGEYYYTLSDKNFENFEVYVLNKQNGNWSAPEKAFFNSSYNEHGMSFSPDGNSIFFSSTRPVNMDDIPQTWHIWKSDKGGGEWTEPVFVDIPNLRHKLLSHPVITNSGTLYFHSSNLDYSTMDIYQAKRVNNTFQDAEKVSISATSNSGRCTPYVSPGEEFLVFASIGNQLDLYVSFNDGKGNWTGTKKLGDPINSLGQGNPYVTPDQKFLFFTTGGYQEKEWKVQWVNIESELKN